MRTFSQSIESEKTPMLMRTKASEKSSYQINSSADIYSDASGGGGTGASADVISPRHGRPRQAIVELGKLRTIFTDGLQRVSQSLLHRLLVRQ